MLHEIHQKTILFLAIGGLIDSLHYNPLELIAIDSRHVSIPNNAANVKPDWNGRAKLKQAST